jgi:hypothetical protein
MTPLQNVSEQAKAHAEDRLEKEFSLVPEEGNDSKNPKNVIGGIKAAINVRVYHLLLSKSCTSNIDPNLSFVHLHRTLTFRKKKNLSFALNSMTPKHLPSVQLCTYKLVFAVVFFNPLYQDGRVQLRA